mgnify:CR=1 FL=1
MDLMCLALMIFLEARGEPLPGQYAVGQVILNRVANEEFPDTVCEVIQQPGQFAPIVYKRGAIVERSVAALVATDLYLRYRPNTEVLWFYNPKNASPSWVRKLTPAFEIGGHLFLKRKP